MGSIDKALPLAGFYPDSQIILLDYADESHQDFDELLIEKNRYGAIWLHFAVRPFSNRRKVNFINA